VCILNQIAVIGHRDSVLAQVLLLVELVLNGPDGLPARLNLNLGGDFFEGIGVDVFDLSGHNVAGLGQLAYGLALLKRARNVSIVEADLLGWGVLGVQYIGLDVQTVARLDQHTAQLATTEDSDLA
jgi:hypothetical protein